MTWEWLINDEGWETNWWNHPRHHDHDRLLLRILEYGPDEGEYSLRVNVLRQIVRYLTTKKPCSINRVDEVVYWTLVSSLWYFFLTCLFNFTWLLLWRKSSFWHIWFKFDQIVDLRILFLRFQQSLPKLVEIGGGHNIRWSLKHVFFDGFQECKCKVLDYDFAIGKFVRCLNILVTNKAV